MNAIKALIGLAVVQALLILVTWRQPDTSPPGSRALLELGTSDVTEVEIEASGERVVQLRRDGDAWTVANRGGYPVLEDAATELVEALSALTIGRDPIATNAISHAALDVSDREFGRRVRVTAGENSQSFYLGRSDTGGLNVRPEGGDEVFSGRGAQLSDFDANPGSYVERAFVSLPASEMTSLLIENQHGRIALTRDGESWIPDVVPAGREVDADAVQQVVDAASTVRLSEPAERGRFDAPVTVTWSAVDAEGSETGGYYEIGASAGSYRDVRVDGAGHVAKVTESSLRAILEASPESLSKEPEAAASE